MPTDEPVSSDDFATTSADAATPAVVRSDGSTTARPHLAARVEDRVNGWLGARLRRRRDWLPVVFPYTGYGGTDATGRSWVRVLCRVVLRPAQGSGVAPYDRRGWRSYLSVPAPHERVLVHVGGQTREVETDRAGYVDLRVDLDVSLEPGWHTGGLEVGDTAPRPFGAVVVGPATVHGVVSDIDDTAMITHLPRLFLAAWNTFVVHPRARRPVPGMADLYRDLEARTGDPAMPFVYLSTGAWNTAATLRRFLAVHGFPRGPLLLTDWGPTNTGWFRSGPAHKNGQLDRLFAELPHVHWILVGDDGQHDPEIYERAVRLEPEHVEAVAIRHLTSVEQVLSHGTPVPLPRTGDRVHRTVPVVSGVDGEAIRSALLPVLES